MTYAFRWTDVADADDDDCDVDVEWSRRSSVGLHTRPNRT